MTDLPTSFSLGNYSFFSTGAFNVFKMKVPPGMVPKAEVVEEVAGAAATRTWGLHASFTAVWNQIAGDPNLTLADRTQLNTSFLDFLSAMDTFRTLRRKGTKADAILVDVVNARDALTSKVEELAPKTTTNGRYLGLLAWDASSYMQAAAVCVEADARDKNGDPLRTPSDVVARIASGLKEPWSPPAASAAIAGDVKIGAARIPGARWAVPPTLHPLNPGDGTGPGSGGGTTTDDTTSEPGHNRSTHVRESEKPPE